ncbi:hypothetical protein SAMN02745664_12432 [Moraxella cuniculi DSM 21768]|uniref:Lipoprotein n=1 Tax=Moraxella cuniculi DSM 21768 TaxID=1122245 RepID=A0A1N7G7A4_9GAMM|nr:hypothetical protein [Moraxella cuniculi]OOS04370.1 hypothetical protein B0189_08665 [Moraxella cuniculi]SIS08394.1 hypothetical protein SAMN02745664_12432 [Moraxella cuniculi DSM 21768]
MKKLIFTGLAATMIVGCASVPMDYTPTTKQISEPPIGSVNTASLGDKLLIQGTATERLALYVPLAQKLGLGASLTQGYYPKSGEKDGFEYFSVVAGADAGRVHYLGGMTTSPAMAEGAVVLRKADNALCFLNGVAIPSGCTTGLSFEKKNWATTGSSTFQQTLLYNGKVGNKINIAYREFSSDVARPAFNNDVEYDLSESKQIGYKGALLEVIEATNQSITYKVIKNFNTN